MRRHPQYVDEVRRLDGLPRGAERTAAEQALAKGLAARRAADNAYVEYVRRKAREMVAEARKQGREVDLTEFFDRHDDWVLERINAKEFKDVAFLRQRRQGIRDTRTQELERARWERVADEGYLLRHDASVKITGADGRVVSSGRFQSGGVTKADRERYGWREASNRSHTEAKAVEGMPLQQGQTMRITGQYPPCGSCQARMEAAAISSGGAIVYWWPGETRSSEMRFPRR